MTEMSRSARSIRIAMLGAVALAVFVSGAAAAEDFRGNPHTPIGLATLTVTGVPPNDALVVSNIGGAGTDGVLIEPADPDASFAIDYGPFGSSSFSIQHRVPGTPESKSFVVTSVVHSASEPMPYETGGDPGDSYNTYFYSGPILVFQSPLPEAPGVLAESVLLPERVVITPGLYGDEISIEYILPVPEEVVYVPEMLTFTADRIVIERIETGGAAAGPALTLTQIEVTAADLPELTILDETPAPASLPLFGAWGLVLFSGALSVSGALVAGGIRRSRGRGV